SITRSPGSPRGPPRGSAAFPRRAPRPAPRAGRTARAAIADPFPRGYRRAMSKKTLAMILAGGEGRRLAPLTHERAKPAVPFGGRYRIIDFVLSNFANSDVLRVKVLTQYKSDSLNTHISRGWRLSAML